MNPKQTGIIVVGGGASGIMASIFAKKNSDNVILIDKNERIGRKLLTTGNGRCNLTNESVSVINYHCTSKNFPAGILGKFNNIDAMNFFKKLGLGLITEDKGRIFPQSNQASSVLDLLRLELSKLGVELECNTDITSIVKDKTGNYELTDSSGRIFKSFKVILAGGGKAAPHTGSDGSGYSLAMMTGHSLITPFPALVGLTLDGDEHKSMEKMFWTGEITIFLDGKRSKSSKGDIIFTNFGISGLAVLELSRYAMEGILNNKEVELAIDFIPELSAEEKIKFIKKRKEDYPERPMEHFFTGVLNKRIGQMMIKKAGIRLNNEVSKMSMEDIERLAGLLNGWKFKVKGDNGWNNAQVTAGGINCDEVDESTLESKISRGLYFCGEILDVDGDSGGYNLQWAWSSGYLAGVSASGSFPFDSGGGF